MKIIHEPKHNDTIDATDSMYPSLLEVASGDGGTSLERGDSISTTYGYVVKGSVGMQTALGLGTLWAGGFFALPGKFKIRPSADGMVVLITRYGYRGQPVMGMTEQRGRLTYIDGCSDSMLVYPARQGDPCLNYLHFPPGVNQTQHTHPSIRMGVVARGSGFAYGPSRVLGDWESQLSTGCVFLLEEQEMHSFRTTESKESMDVIAYHPDSDWGPTDQQHPMFNRTYLGANALSTRGG